jgi:hypothetical protein
MSVNPITMTRKEEAVMAHYAYEIAYLCSEPTFFGSGFAPTLSPDEGVTDATSVRAITLMGAGDYKSGFV